MVFGLNFGPNFGLTVPDVQPGQSHQFGNIKAEENTTFGNIKAEENTSFGDVAG